MHTGLRRCQIHCFAILLLLLSHGVVAANSASLTVYSALLDSVLYQEYQQLLLAADSDPRQFVEQSQFPPEFDRHQAEHLVLQLALANSGCQCRVKYHPLSDLHPQRASTLVQQGEYLVQGIAVFPEALSGSDQVLFSRPILPENSLFVGLYTLAQRDDVLSVSDSQSIKALRYAVGRSWKADRAVLESHGFSTVVANSWENLVALLHHRRADVVLQPFTDSQDMAYIDRDGVLKPVPNVKLHFPLSRRYAVSKNHPDSALFLSRLNRGLRALERSGQLRRIFQKAGVIDNPRVSDFVEFP